MKKLLKLMLKLFVAVGLLQSQGIIAMDQPDAGPSISRDSLTLLYQDLRHDDGGDSFLFIPMQELVNADGVKVDLRELFARHGLCTFLGLTTDAWDDDLWDLNFSKLIAMQIEPIKKTMEYYRYHEHKYTIDQLSTLLADAKKLLKSFLGSENDFQGPFVKKSGLNRIFTYAKLQQVIADKQLHHVRLPIKRIFIQDKTTGKYLPKVEASMIVDDALKICVRHRLACKILFVSDKYDLKIFASKEKTEGKGLSKAAQQELFVLCEEAPFDIGDDNIFWDAKGDAIIIDTEYKDMSVHDCQKIKRYPVDPEL